MASALILVVPAEDGGVSGHRLCRLAQLDTEPSGGIAQTQFTSQPLSLPDPQDSPKPQLMLRNTGESVDSGNQLSQEAQTD